MVGSLFAPEEVESERTVILSERQGAENNPGYALYEEVVGSAFHAHPYRHMVIGYECDLRAISRDDLYPALPPLLSSGECVHRCRRRFRQPAIFLTASSTRSERFPPASRFHGPSG